MGLKAITSIINTMIQPNSKNKRFWKHLKIKSKDINQQMLEKNPALLIRYKKNKLNYLDRALMNLSRSTKRLRRNHLLFHLAERPFLTKCSMSAKNIIFLEPEHMGKLPARQIKAN